MFGSGLVSVPNRFKPVLRISDYQKPQPKKRFGFTKSWNHNQNRWFGFGLNRFSVGTEPDRGSTTLNTVHRSQLSSLQSLEGFTGSMGRGEPVQPIFRTSVLLVANTNRESDVRMEAEDSNSGLDDDDAVAEDVSAGLDVLSLAVDR